MDTNDREEPRNNTDPASQDDDRATANPASSAIIGTNIMGINTATFPGGIVAPAAALAPELSANSADEDVGALDFEGLEQFGSNRRESGDDGVSTDQSELEASELNG